MSQLLTPPRPTDLDSREEQALDREALIKEARRRARRRRAAYAGTTLLAIGAGLGAFFAFGGGGTSPSRPTHTAQPPRGLSAAATIKGTIPFPLTESTLFSARAGSLFVLVIPPNRALSFAVERVGTNETAKRRRVQFDQPGSLMDVSVGPYGVYGGTASIAWRYTAQPDELVRIDPTTLTVRARASFPANVTTIEQGERMWASIGDGRVVRLDPRTLAVVVSQRVLPIGPAASRAVTLSKPAVGLGSLWVLAGDAVNLELVRLDPTTLAVRSKTRVPTGGNLRQAMNQVVADARHVYLVGRAIAPVGRNGRLTAPPVATPDLATAAIHDGGLVGLTGARPAIVLLDKHGRILARTRVHDAGGYIAVSGEDAWFLGNAGHGNGIVHVHLAPR